MLERFESIKPDFMDWANEVDSAMEAWIKVMDSDDVRQSRVAIDRVKSELCRREMLGSFSEDWSFFCLGCLAHIASIKSYVGVCES